MEKVKIGIIGCGNISPIYFESGRKFDILDIVACADLDEEKAQAKASEYGITAMKVEELLAHPEIEIIINLTIPNVHAELHCRILEAGKHTYGEKPLAVYLEDGQRILNLADKNNLLVGSAPDTFLGGGIQTCRKLIDDGWIGEPIGATAFMMALGPESWHPNPSFLYEEGAGPMFDMGPYYLTALINLIGPVKSVVGSTQTTFKERTITNEMNYGKRIPVRTPTHVSGMLHFESGATASMIMSFDVIGSKLPDIEIYGTEGTLVVPHPNFYDGPVYVKRKNHKEFIEVPLTHRFTENSRGLGLMDMAYAIRNKREHRANGNLAYHVLEIMHGFYQSSDEGTVYKLKSSCKKPDALPIEQLENSMEY